MYITSRRSAAFLAGMLERRLGRDACNKRSVCARWATTAQIDKDDDGDVGANNLCDRCPPYIHKTEPLVPARLVSLLLAEWSMAPERQV